jgi:hypothetical protein
LGFLCLEPRNWRGCRKSKGTHFSEGRDGQRENMPRRRNALRSPSAKSAFLNLPYDEEFKDLFLAYIAGVTAFGLVPRATLEIPGGERRLDRILQLIRNCRFSIHDLSRVELDRSCPPTPRFNLPFEPGLAIGSLQHSWFVFFGNLATRLSAASDNPRSRKWRRSTGLKQSLPSILDKSGSRSFYSARVSSSV